MADHLGLRVIRRDGGGDLRRPSFVNVGHHDRGPGRGESPSDCLADAGAGSRGDEHDAPSEFVRFHMLGN